MASFLLFSFPFFWTTVQRGWLFSHTLAVPSQGLDWTNWIGVKFQILKGTIIVFKWPKMVNQWDRLNTGAPEVFLLLDIVRSEYAQCCLLAKMTVIGKMEVPYEEKILLLQQNIASFPAGSEIWMEAIIRNWFGFSLPRPWQVQNTLHLYHGMDVFLTSSTGSGKTTLLLASVIAQTIMNRPHIALVIYPTCALMDDQVQ